MNNFGLSFVDYVVIILYFALMMGMGYWIGRRQHDTKDYFLAGKSMAWWPIAISLYASLFSAISYVSQPGEGYNHGMTLFLFKILMVVPMPIMILLFLRMFYRLKLWTAYQYLELRFDSKIRLVGSLLFLMLRGAYLGIILYATAIIMEPITGWPLWVTIVVVGLVATVYTALGGMAAAIWTDVVQFFILVMGIGSVIFAVRWEVDGGFSEIWRLAVEMDHGFNIGPDSGFWTLDLRQRLSALGWALGLLPLCIAPAIDQIKLQQCMASNSFKTAAMAVVGSSVGSIPITGMFYFAGVCLFIYFNVLHPGVLPENMRGDGVIAYFASYFLPTGLCGLFIASVLAAVMSTANSALNSLSAVTMKDFYERIIRPGRSEAHYLLISKWLTFVWGAIAIVSGLGVVALYSTRNIPFLEISNITLGYFGALMLGVFCLGLLTYRSNTRGVIIGTVSGAVIHLYVLWVYYLSVEPAERISFLYFDLVGIVAVFIVGYVASIMLPSDISLEKRKYVVWSQFNKWRESRANSRVAGEVS